MNIQNSLQNKISLITVMTSKMQIISLQFLLYLIQFWMIFYEILENIEKTFSQRFCWPKT